MKLEVSPGNPLVGTIEVPGDKSLSHRAILLASLADGESRISNLLVSGVTKVMLESLSALGVEWIVSGDDLVVQGHGPSWKIPEQVLNCGNSATTMRLLAGALATCGIPAVLDGSSGLRRRPMDRIVKPLSKMGVDIKAHDGVFAPLILSGRDRNKQLKPLYETLSVASAQVKSCLILAALSADDISILREPGPSRDHTERMLASMGISITKYTQRYGDQLLYITEVNPYHGAIQPIQMSIPGDMSAASFLIVAALITPGSKIKIPGVGINPTRNGIIEVLQKMGGNICITNERIEAGEPVGDVTVHYSSLFGTEVNGPLVVRMIDEFSVYGVAAAFSTGQTLVKDASELRIKESDRISSLCEELAKLGVDIIENSDGFVVNGGRLPRGGLVQSHGDHRLAMALAVLGLGASSPITIDGAEVIDESFPNFYSTLRELGAEVRILGDGKV